MRTLIMSAILLFASSCAIAYSPNLTQAEISAVTAQILAKEFVEDAAVQFDEEHKMAAVIVTVTEDCSIEQAKELGVEYATELARNADGRGPSGKYMGELWENYTLGIALDIKGEMIACTIRQLDKTYFTWDEKPYSGGED